MAVTGPQMYVLRLGLGPVPASTEEVWTALEGPLEPFDARLTRHRSDVQLQLRIVAADLWAAILLAMAAVTTTGYPVLDVTAHTVRPSDQSEAAIGPNSEQG